MAEYSVNYIIKLLSDDSQLKKKLKENEQEITSLNAHERAEVKKTFQEKMNALEAVAKSANDNPASISMLDTDKLKDELEFMQDVFKAMKELNPAEDWTKSGKMFVQSFSSMHEQLSKLAGSVETLKTSVDGLEDSFTQVGFNIKPVSEISTAVTKTAKDVSKGSQKIKAAIERIEVSSKDSGGLEVKKKQLQQFVKMAKDFQMPKFDSMNLDQLEAEIDILDEKWDQLEKKFEKDIAAHYKTNKPLPQAYRTEAALIQAQQIALYDAWNAKAPEIGYDRNSIKESVDATNELKKSVQQVLKETEQSLKDLQKEINTSLKGTLSQVISEQMSDIQLTLALPDEDVFVDQINNYISAINQKPLESIHIAIDESANVIRDQSKQAHGDNPPSNDANTDNLVKKTEERFKRVVNAIKDKQKAILDNTKTWRDDMIAAMKIASSDLEFEFGWDKKLEGGAQLLKDALQTYFDMPGNELNIHIDHEALAEELQSALTDGGITVNTGGTTTIANLDEIVSTILFGKSKTTTETTSSAIVTPSQQKPIVTEGRQEKQSEDEEKKQYVTKFDAASTSVQDLIERLKQVADILYGKKRVAASAKEIGKWLAEKGIDLESVYKNKLSDDQITSQLTEALLVQDEMGYAKGSSIASDLDVAIKKYKVTNVPIQFLPELFNKLFAAYGVITETAEEWDTRVNGVENVQYYINAGRSLGLLNRARYPFKPGNKNDIVVDGGMYDIGNDLHNVITNLQAEKDSIIADLQKDKDELTNIRKNAKMTKGDSKSQYQKDYLAAKQIYAEATAERKQAEIELENAKNALGSSVTDYEKKNALQSYKSAKEKFDTASKQEKEARHLELESLGVWQNARNKVKTLLASIEKKEAILESFQALESMQLERLALDDNPTEEAMLQFKNAGLEFYEKSKTLFAYLNSKFQFKGAVAIDGGNELIHINSPFDILKSIPEKARITYFESYGDHSTSAVGSGFNGSSYNRSSSYKKANSQERQMIKKGGIPPHLIKSQSTRAVVDEPIEYTKFHTLESKQGIDISGEKEQQKIQQLTTEISAGQTQITSLDAQIADKKQELASLTEQLQKYSKKKQQDAVDAVENQLQIIAKAKITQQQIEDKLKEIDGEIETARLTQNRLQTEFENISDVDVQREQNMLQIGIRNLADMEPILQKNITTAKKEYDVSKSVYEYADKIVQKREAELSQAKEIGDQTLIDQLSAEFEFAIKERVNAQVTFQNATQKLNDANAALESNISQRNNIQAQIDGISIDTVRSNKRKQLDEAIARVTTLESEQSDWLRRKQYHKEGQRLIEDELVQLKNRPAYKLQSQISQAQIDQSSLEHQKQQVKQDIIAKKKQQEQLVILSKKLELQRQYNELQAKSLQLTTEINNLDKADDSFNSKKEELAHINDELESLEIKINDLGGFVDQTAPDIAPSQKHQHGLSFAVKYQKMLDIAYQQMEELPALIKSYEEKERQVKKYGRKQHDVRTEVSVQKQRLRNEFLSSDYVKAELEILKEEAEREIQIARDGVYKRARNLAVDVDPHDVEDYIRKEHPELRADLEKQEKAIWDNYEAQKKQRRQDLLTEFKKKNLTTTDGIVSAVIDGVRQTYDVKKAYLDEIIAKKTRRKEQLDTLLPSIDALEQQKSLAMAYGNVQESEVVFNTPDIVKKLGQATKNVDAALEDSESLLERTEKTSDNIDQDEDVDPNDVGHGVNDSFSNNGGLIGALNEIVNKSTAIDISKLATEETLSAIRDLLGGGDDFVEETKPQIEQGHLSRNVKKTDTNIVTEKSSQQVMTEGMEARITRANALSEKGLPVSRARLLLNGDDAFSKMLGGDKIKDVIDSVVLPKVLKQLEDAGFESWEQFNEKLSSIADNSVWKTKKEPSWIHFATPDAKFNGSITKKAYGSFSNIGNLSSELINTILNELASKGFKGQIKIPKDITGFYDTDQIVGHAVDDNSFRILVDTLQKFANNGVLSSVATGVDANTKVLRGKNGASFTQLIGEIYKAAPGKTFTVEEIKSIITSILKDKSGKFDQDLVKPIVDDFVNKRVAIDKPIVEGKTPPVVDNAEYKKAIDTIFAAIGDATAQTVKDQASIYAEKVHSNQEVVAAATFLKANKNLLSGKDVDLWNKLLQFRESYYKISDQTTSGVPTEETQSSNENAELLEQIANTVEGFVAKGIITAEEGEVYSKFLHESAHSDENRILDSAEEEALKKINEKISNFFDQQLPSDEVPDNDGSSQDADIQPKQLHAQAGVTTALEPKSEIVTQSTSDTTKTNGGLIGIMRNELAKESTLQKVLTALCDIAKKNAMAGMGKQNSAQDLLEQFRRMLESDAWEGKERVAYLDLETGSISNSITGTDKEISTSLLQILRDAYKNMDMNAMVHTHANQEDPYFSPADFSLFGSDELKGITKQILLSKNNMTVLDMTDVKDINGLLVAMADAEQNFEELATTANNFGAKYVSRAFDDITPQGLVKMLGIKGIESKYTEVETHEASRKGVLAEDAKEAADMLQESTGRAIKKTVERVGLEFETWVEKTDTKGNKTWSSQINNKFEKAMQATNKDIESQKLDSQFGAGTKASVALAEYRKIYQQLTDYVKQFNASTSDTEKSGLQKQINDLIPVFNKAEKELVDLIARKEQFLRVGEKLDDVLGQESIGKGALEEIATREFFGDELTAGQNIATAGTQSTKNGRQLLVDILDNGTISRYGIEVDEVTGQVRKLTLSEGDLANAFQNVNRAMRENVRVVSSVALGDDPEQVAQFLKTASSPEWDTYNRVLLQMKDYTADLWNTMKGGTSATQEQLDYLMMLSELAISLGKNIQKTSVDFKNFWAQNPGDILAIDQVPYDSTDRSEKIREALEKKAKEIAIENNSEYNFSSFDTDTLQFTLTDVDGQISKLAYEFNELYNKVVVTSDKATSTLDPIVGKINGYGEALAQVVNDGYLMDADVDYAKFKTAVENISQLVSQVKSGTTTFQKAKDELAKLRQEALKYGEAAKKTANQNKRLFAGTGAKKSVDNQYNKIVGARQVSVENFDSQFSDESELFKLYNNAYTQLNNNYNDYVANHKLNDPAIQKQIQQEAAKVQMLGKKYLASVTQVEKLYDLVDQSGTYTDQKTGEERQLGGTTNITTEELVNLEETMRGFVQNGLQQANIEAVKFDATNQRLTYTFRTSKNTVADMVVQYNDATKALFAYQKQERESLTGFAGFMHSMKGKMKSILQYTASITSIYRVFGELKRGIQYIREIDSALTELKKVTNETQKTYDNFLKTAAKTADKVGSTIKEVVSSTADWARLNI